MIRAFRADDTALLAQLQRNSIRELGPQAYSAVQVEAWLARAKSPEYFEARSRAGDRISVWQGSSAG